MTLYANIGRWQEIIKEIPPHKMKRVNKDSVILDIRNNAKKRKIKEGEVCQLCEEDILEVLRKHHLVLIAAYPEYGNELNKHLAILCENCHDLVHLVIYGDRGGITWQSVEKLKERGLWDSLVEIDKQAVEALKILEQKHQRSR